MPFVRLYSGMKVMHVINCIPVSSRCKSRFRLLWERCVIASHALVHSDARPGERPGAPPGAPPGARPGAHPGAGPLLSRSANYHTHSFILRAKFSFNDWFCWFLRWV